MLNKYLRLIVPILLGLVMCPAGDAKAAFITYTITTGGSGSLGASSFNNANVTLRFVGDTANVVNPEPGVFYNSLGTATVTIDGLGTATFTQPISVYTDGSYVGFYGGSSYSHRDFTGGILNINALGAAGFALNSSFGPASGGGFTSFTPAGFATNRGAFILPPPGSGTFAASTTSAVPEPSSLALCGFAGLAGLGIVRFRRKRTT